MKIAFYSTKQVLLSWPSAEWFWLQSAAVRSRVIRASEHLLRKPTSVLFLRPETHSRDSSIGTRPWSSLSVREWWCWCRRRSSNRPSAFTSCMLTPEHWQTLEELHRIGIKHISFRVSRLPPARTTMTDDSSAQARTMLTSIEPSLWESELFTFRHTRRKLSLNSLSAWYSWPSESTTKHTIEPGKATSCWLVRLCPGAGAIVHAVWLKYRTRRFQSARQDDRYHWHWKDRSHCGEDFISGLLQQGHRLWSVPEWTGRRGAWFQVCCDTRWAAWRIRHCEPALSFDKVNAPHSEPRNTAEAKERCGTHKRGKRSIDQHESTYPVWFVLQSYGVMQLLILS